jgi:hypothetical protein
VSTTRPSTPTPTPETALAPLLAELIAVLTTLLADHRELAAGIERKREAIRAADIDAIAGLCHAEGVIAQRLREVERGRVAIVGRLTELLAPGASAPLGLVEIADRAERAGAAEAAALRTLAIDLRAEVRAVRRASSVVASAAVALNRHVTGVMQTVNSMLSRVGVYERRGRIAVGSQLDYCVDVKS